MIPNAVQAALVVQEFKKLSMKLLNLLFLFTVFTAFSQEAKLDHVQTISNEACDCISSININNGEINDAIKNCIGISLKKNTNNTTHKQVETYLVEHCEALKQIAFSENKEFKHATSENVLAQLAYEDGMEYLEEGDYESALLKFKKAVDIDSKFAFAWDNLGVTYRKNNEFDKAIQAYLKSLDINPEGRLPLMNIAVAYNLTKDYDKAIKYYNKFISIYKEDPEGYYGLGLILYTNDKLEDGLDNLIHAYTIYTAQNSPYRTDAAKKIGYMYNDLKNKNKMDIFNKVATKYNLEIESN